LYERLESSHYNDDDSSLIPFSLFQIPLPLFQRGRGGGVITQEVAVDSQKEECRNGNHRPHPWGGGWERAGTHPWYRLT
jgi:hypothetical protein